MSRLIIKQSSPFSPSFLSCSDEMWNFFLLNSCDSLSLISLPPPAGEVISRKNKYDANVMSWVSQYIIICRVASGVSDKLVSDIPAENFELFDSESRKMLNCFVSLSPQSIQFEWISIENTFHRSPGGFSTSRRWGRWQSVDDGWLNDLIWRELAEVERKCIANITGEKWELMTARIS